MTVFWFLLYAQKERPGGEPYRFCTLQNQCPAARRSPAWPKNLLPTFLHRKVGPRRRAMLTIPLQKAPPAEGEMKLRHGFCRQSLRLISFATSLCTREAFAVRRLQTFPRRAGVLAKPCKRPAPPPGDHQLDLKSLCLLLFLSHQVCMDRKKTVRLFSLCFGAGRRNSPGSERSICQTMEKAAKARPFPANAFAGQARSGRYNGE